MLLLTKSFRRVFTDHQLLSRCRKFHLERLNGGRLAEFDISIEAVKKLMNNIKAHSSAGPAGVHPRVLRECADALARLIHVIFVESLQTGCLPTDWERANITPMCKKGSKTDPLNYRPITLTNVLCKLLEKSIVSNIMDHLETNELLSPKVLGLRRHRHSVSMLMSLLMVTVVIGGRLLLGSP